MSHEPGRDPFDDKEGQPATTSASKRMADYIEQLYRAGALNDFPDPLQVRNDLIKHWNAYLGPLGEEGDKIASDLANPPAGVFHKEFEESVRRVAGIESKTADQRLASTVDAFADKFMLSANESISLRSRLKALGTDLEESERLARYKEALSGPEFNEIAREVMTEEAKKRFDAAWTAKWGFIDVMSKDPSLGSMERAQWVLALRKLNTEKAVQRQGYVDSYLDRIGAISGDADAGRDATIQARHASAADYIGKATATTLQTVAPAAIRNDATRFAAASQQQLEEVVQQDVAARAAFYERYDAIRKLLADNARKVAPGNQAKRNELEAVNEALGRQAASLLDGYIRTGVPAGTSAGEYLDQYIPGIIRTAAPSLAGGVVLGDAVGSAVGAAAFETPEEKVAATALDKRVKLTTIANDKTGAYDARQIAQAKQELAGGVGVASPLSPTGSVADEEGQGQDSDALKENFRTFIENLGIGFPAGTIKPGKDNVPTFEQFKAAVRAGALVPGTGDTRQLANQSEVARISTVLAQYGQKFGMDPSLASPATMEEYWKRVNNPLYAPPTSPQRQEKPALTTPPPSTPPAPALSPGAPAQNGAGAAPPPPPAPRPPEEDFNAAPASAPPPAEQQLRRKLEEDEMGINR